MADPRRAPLKDQTDITGARALIVEARFYDDIQDALMAGAVAELKAVGVTHDVITVPGALEIPAAIAIAIDAAIYGPDRPETAADIANLGMLMNDAGQPTAGVVLLKQALAIYEKTLGANSDEAKLIRDNLAHFAR